MFSIIKILGILTAIIITGGLMILNSGPAHVDVLFTEADTAVFIIIMASFVAGFFSCYVFMTLKNIKKREKFRKQNLTNDRSLIGEI